RAPDRKDQQHERDQPRHARRARLSAKVRSCNLECGLTHTLWTGSPLSGRGRRWAVGEGHHPNVGQGVAMSSGAYSVFIDQQAGGGPAGALRRVVPLPPPDQSGAVKFTTVVLSLAYDNFGDASALTIPATVRVLRGSGTVDTLNVTIEVGRKWFHFLQA